MGRLVQHLRRHGRACPGHPRRGSGDSLASGGRRQGRARLHRAPLPAPDDVEARNKSAHDARDAAGAGAPYSRNDTRPWRTAWSMAIQITAETIVVTRNFSSSFGLAGALVAWPCSTWSGGSLLPQGRTAKITIHQVTT